MCCFRRIKQNAKWSNIIQKDIISLVLHTYLLPSTFYLLPKLSDLLRCLIILLLPATCYLLPATATAAIQWSASAVTGYYTPRLEELNYVLQNREVELGPRNTEAKPFSYPVIYQGISPEMPKMRPDAPKMGLQIQADLNPLYAMY